MGLFWNECRKVLCTKTTLILLLLFCIADGVLLNTYEKGRRLFFSPEQYKEVYRGLEGQTFESALSYLRERQQEDFSGYYLAESILAEVEASSRYEEYVDNMIRSADRLNTVSIFQKKDDFANRNINKLAEVYGKMPKADVVIGPARGVSMAAGYAGTDILVILFTVFLTFSVVARERETGQLLLTKTTRRGHAAHAVCKLAVCGAGAVLAVLALESVNLFMAQSTYGLGDLRLQELFGIDSDIRRSFRIGGALFCCHTRQQLFGSAEIPESAGGF